MIANHVNKMVFPKLEIIFRVAHKVQGFSYIHPIQPQIQKHLFQALGSILGA